MACGHAKFTGEIGVCLATSGPGAIHLLNGLYDARLDHVPVLALVGQPALSAMGGSYQRHGFEPVGGAAQSPRSETWGFFLWQRVCLLSAVLSARVAAAPHEGPPLNLSRC
jgi:Thiamine pyrophosphate enzyme, N-terminal TPP binding domain